MYNTTNVLIDDNTLHSIADSIRSKTGTSRSITPSQMVNNICQLHTGETTVSNISESDFINSNYSVYENKNLNNIRDYLFYNNANLQTVNCPNVIQIGRGAFYQASITSITLDNVMTLGYESFSHCKSLKEINLPNAITLGSFEFSLCYTLTKVAIPKVTHIPNNCFYGCLVLDLNSSDCQISWDQLEYIDTNAFGSCALSGEINLPKCWYIGRGAFDSTKLTSVVANNLRNIQGMCFNSNTLTRIECINAETLAQNTFGYSSTVKRTMEVLKIPNIISIDTNAFNSISVDKLDFHKKVNIDSLPKGKCNIILRSSEKCIAGSNISRNAYLYPTLYVPRSIIDEYKNDNIWGTHTINAIEDYPDICGSGE